MSHPCRKGRRRLRKKNLCLVEGEKTKQADRLTKTQEVIVGLIVSSLSLGVIVILKDWMVRKLSENINISIFGIDPELVIAIILLCIIALLAWFGIVKEESLSTG